MVGGTRVEASPVAEHPPFGVDPALVDGGSGPPPAGRMIFLVGVPRSGTNWLQRLVALHPDVVALPSETHLFSDGINHLQRRVQHGLVSSPATGTIYMDRADFLDAVRNLCDAAYGGAARAIDPTARRILERTPAHVHHLELLGAVYPDAHVVHIVRDGRDVARSMVAQSWGPADVAGAAREWVEGVTAARRAAGGLRHYLEVRYEALLDEPVEGVREVLGFLGLNAGPDLLRQVFGEAGIPYNEDPNLPRLAREKWRGQWSRRDSARFWAVAGPLMAELGYGGPEPATPRVLPWSGAGAPAVARRLGRRVRRLYSRPRTTRSDLQERMGLAQHTVDRFFAAVGEGACEAAAALLGPAGKVRIVTAGGDHSHYGEGAGEALAAVLADDRRNLGRQLRSESSVSGYNFVVVLSHHRVDGAGSVDRLFVIGVEGDRIAQLWYYRFPLATPAVPAGNAATDADQMTRLPCPSQ